jgi:spore photoproduct lyase
MPFKGAILKPCPGTRGYICCGYRILNVGTNCPLDCSYCILQAYFKEDSLRIFSNIEERLGEVADLIDSSPQEIFRIGTGEFTDSLALEPIARFSSFLLPFFSERKNAVLELKTKTINIDALLASRHRRGIIVSWSLNSPFISEREEKSAPPLERRLEAARRCQREGFAVGFHFDPIVAHSNWKDGYRRTVELLDRYIDPRGVIWISLGTFRFMPELKAIVRKRHPGSCILDGEFITGLDGKMRYFKPIRIELYKFVKDCLNNWERGLCLYLCMESDEIWCKAMDWSPGESKGLAGYLDERVRRFFG